MAMPFDPEKHHRRSIRLRGYDYSLAGAYFVTMCVQGRAGLFGAIADGEMRLNDAGRMVDAIWNELPGRFPRIGVDTFVVMPNHVHGVIVVGAALVAAPEGATTRVAPTVGTVIGAFKSLTTVAYGRGVDTEGWPPFRGRLWQRNYYEHVIRDEAALDRIRQYILDNPARWDFDRENPAVVAPEPENAWRL